jgi:hypothetical protein
MNAWSLLPWYRAEVPGHGLQEVAVADQRAGVLCVAGHDPYAWKGAPATTPADVYLRRLTPQP